jgi:RNA polymerase sigma factor (sigma-70 family)
VDDCESDVVLIAVEHAAELLSHPNSTGWFVVTAQNVAHNARRKEITRTHNLISVSEFKSETDMEPLEDILYKEWVNDGIPEELISRLAPREREVYKLIFLEHMSTKGISDKLGISESTVRNIKKNIMDKIKYDIKKHNFESL